MSSTVSNPQPENESQRLAAEAMHEKEEALRVLVTQMPAVLWTTDLDLRFTEGTGAGRAAMGETDDVRGSASSLTSRPRIRSFRRSQRTAGRSSASP